MRWAISNAFHFSYAESGSLSTLIKRSRSRSLFRASSNTQSESSSRIGKSGANVPEFSDILGRRDERVAGRVNFVQGIPYLAVEGVRAMGKADEDSSIEQITHQS